MDQNNPESNRRLSPADELYMQLVGELPAKAGAAHEIISTAIMHILTGSEATHDQRMRGLSDTVYQIDGLLGDDVMLEAKDYAIDGEKVGRGDLQKLQGALTDLPKIKEGIFSSATDYTKPANKYAAAADQNPNHKPITNFVIKPSTVEDEKGRVKTIVVKIVIPYLDTEHSRQKIVVNKNSKELLKKYLDTQGNLTQQGQFYHLDGTPYTPISREPVELQSDEFDKQEIERFFPCEGYYLFGNDRIYIDGFKVFIPIGQEEEKFEIKMDGNPVALAKSDQIGYDKLITDKQLIKAINEVIKKH